MPQSFPPPTDSSNLVLRKGEGSKSARFTFISPKRSGSQIDPQCGVTELTATKSIFTSDRNGKFETYIVIDLTSSDGLSINFDSLKVYFVVEKFGSTYLLASFNENYELLG